jgi:hypothetical protein
MEHKFDRLLSIKTGRERQHSASRAAYRIIGSAAYPRQFRLFPDQIDLRTKVIVDCPMDLNPGQIALTAAFSSSLSPGRMRGRCVLRCHHPTKATAPITPTQRPQPMHNPA